MTETFIRFVVGGLFVSAFAVLRDVLKPKSFAGLFGASPSVALATLTLTIHSRGQGFAAAEARSMIFGAIAFFVYACAVCRLIIRSQADGVNSRERIDRDLAGRRLYADAVPARRDTGGLTPQTLTGLAVGENR